MNLVTDNPKFKALQEQTNDAVEAVYESQAKKYLKLYQEMLNPFNMTRHKVTLLCGMGTCCVKIDDDLIHERNWWKRTKLTLLLEEIEASMDWSWGSYLDGKCLNPKEAKHG